MDLSVDLIKEFAKITNDEPVINEGSTVYGKYILQGDEAFVEIDGSDGTLTPVATTSTAKNNDRVTVLIKDHTAIVTGNLTDPSASSEEVEDVKKQMGTTALDIEELKKQLENQEITMQEYDDAIAEAKRKATDYIDFTVGTGLVIGSSTISNNVRIYSGGVDIRNGETILASYTGNKIYLGKENKNASIDLCAGTATIYGDFTDIENSKLYIETGSDLFLCSFGGVALIGNEYHSLGVDFDGIFFNTRQGLTLSYISDERIRLGMTVSSGGSYILIDGEGGHLYGGNWTVPANSHTHKDYASSSHTHNQSSLNLTGTLVTHAVRPASDGEYASGLSNYRWSNVYCKNSTINTSDKNEKTEIKPINNIYIQLFDLLEPVQYMWKDGDRVHTGFISQDLEVAMNKVGLTDMDFAGFCKDLIEDEDGNQQYRYGIRYGEFIGILSAKIKQLEARISELENKEVSQ